eukprot:gene20755-26911_t
MKITTPELLWHGGGCENGKPDPIYSIDIHPMNILATAGVDGSMPPKGAVRLWKVDSTSDNPEFIFELADHQSVINSLKFSPCGKYLATGSDRIIVVYYVKDVNIWSTLNDIQDLEKYWYNPSLDEIFDISWSPDSSHIIAGALNARAEIISISNKEGILLTGHTSYIQGVAWDPLNQMVITQSNDRSCKMHMIKAIPGKKVKLANRGHGVLRMNAETSRHLFADATVPCFFRRPTFSPDGSLIILPTGIYRPNQVEGHSLVTQTFCTYIISRHNFLSPLICLTGLEDPSVAVRCSPVLYKLIDNPQSSPMISGLYRIIFCVLTISTIYIYDTQHSHPIARLNGCHFAAINDACWTPDGNMLIVCSSDCYVTFVRFEPGELGIPLSNEEIPLSVKESHPCMYGYIRPDSTISDIKNDNLTPNTQISHNVDCSNTTIGVMPNEVDVIDCVSEESNNSIYFNPVDDLNQSSQLSGYPESDSIIGISFLPESIIQSKKRRITPIKVKPNDNKVDLSPTIHSMTSLNSSPTGMLCDSPVEESKNITPLGNKDNRIVSESKQKKRIAPMLVSNDISMYKMISSTVVISENNSSSNSQNYRSSNLL